MATVLEKYFFQEGGRGGKDERINQKVQNHVSKRICGADQKIKITECPVAT